MQYIVLDLEWNQCPQGKKKENKALPFEIIEIGAVRLDEKFHIIDEFDRLIKPEVYIEFHYIVKDMLDFSSEDLKREQGFREVAEEFLAWCGKEYIFCTFGCGDLTELQRNMHYFKMENPFPMPCIYYDIQKMASILYDDGKQRRSLQAVLEHMGLPEKEEFHRAINDARYTAAIMQAMDFDKVKAYSSIDSYQIPDKKSNEIHMVYPTYEKYISKGYARKEAALESKEAQNCRCYLCHKLCRPVIPWFSANTKIYYGLYYCDEHGFVKVKMRAKQAENRKYFVTKITKITDNAGVDKIRGKQKAIRRKRQERRHHSEDVVNGRQSGQEDRLE